MSIDERVKTAVDQLLAIDIEVRADKIDEICHDDPTLIDEVKSYLTKNEYVGLRYTS